MDRSTGVILNLNEKIRLLRFLRTGGTLLRDDSRPDGLVHNYLVDNDESTNWRQYSMLDTDGESYIKRRVKLSYADTEGKLWLAAPTAVEIKELPVLPFDNYLPYGSAEDFRKEVGIYSTIKGVGESVTVDGRVYHEAVVSITPTGAWALVFPAKDKYSGGVVNDIMAGDLPYTCPIFNSAFTLESMAEAVSSPFPWLAKMLPLLVEVIGLVDRVKKAKSDMVQLMRPQMEARQLMVSEMRSAKSSMQQARSRIEEQKRVYLRAKAGLVYTPLAMLLREHTLVKSLAHPKISDVKYDPVKEEVSFRVAELDMEHPYNGDIYICPSMSCRMTRLTGEVTFFDPDDTHHGYWSDNDMHPHVSSCGEACFGTVGGMLTQAVVGGDWMTAIELVVRFLGQFDPDDSAGANYKCYSRRTETGEIIAGEEPSSICPNCGSTDAEIETCERCGYEMCGDCHTYIDGSQMYVCEACVRDYYGFCENCGCRESNEDMNELKDSHGNEHTYCTGCFYDYAIHCECCDEDFKGSGSRSVDMIESEEGKLYCPYCAVTHLVFCDRCEKWFDKEDYPSEVVDGVCSSCREVQGDDETTEESEDGDENEN